MSSKSKRKGSNFEREIVNIAKDLGLFAKRAYASNGESLGYTENVDVIISEDYLSEKYRDATDKPNEEEKIWKAQCKRRKRISPLYKVEEGCDIQIFREDNGKAYVTIDYLSFLDLIRDKYA